MPLTNVQDLSGAVARELPEDSTSVWLMVAVIVGAVVALGAARWLWRRLTALQASLGMTILLVMVPRGAVSPTSDKQPEQRKPEKIKEDIGVAEVLWSVVGGLRAPRRLYKILAWFRGRQDHLSLELVAQNGVISFYLAVPQKLKDFVEQQVHAHYPNAVLEEVTDYNIFSPHGVTLGASLRFTRSWGFPIKTYKQFETDPLNAITNALAKVPIGDAAAVQLVVRSAPKSWRRAGVRVASAMQQGKSLQDASGVGLALRTVQSLGNFLPSTSSPKSKHESAKHEPHKLSPLEEEMVKGIEQKASKAGLEVTVRLVASAESHAKAELYLNNLVNSFSQFNVYQYGNSFKYRRPYNLGYFLRNFVHRTFVERKRLILNSEELASLYHFPLPTTETPNVRWLTARQAPPPLNILAEGIVIGESDYRGDKKVVRFGREDRARHCYVVGKSGTGKSVLMENMVVQDIINGDGICIIDPHGDVAEAVLARVPASRAEDIIYFNPADTDRPQGLNLLEYDPRYPEQKTFVINEMIKIMDKLYDLKQTGGPMFEQYMRNAMLLIMDDPESGATLMEISKVLSDPDYRRYKLSKTQNPVVHDFWVKEAQKAGGEASLANMVPYITSKLNQFVANDIMRPIIGQQKSAFNFRQVMDEKKILIVNLSKGRLGDLNAYLIGLVMVGKILMAALSRTDVQPQARHDFYLYIDEFQNFITDSIATILSEARKYRLNLTVAHQYISQLVNGQDTKIRDAVFGNVGTTVAFRVGVEDAEFLAKEFAPVFNAYDLINIELRQAYVKLLINNTPSRPFNIHTLAPTPGNLDLARRYRELSSLKYGRPRAGVEADIIERTKLMSPPPAPAVEPALVNEGPVRPSAAPATPPPQNPSVAGGITI
ncbi:MAG: type IV secretory system conjugative DNA transfer family protein [Candidatus Kerfeldbacteria bacterium]|nr:type IV secretory system conjugative DNA transfer family protein [Candidatus Kerfeldbacteria bacterium]